MTLFGHALLVVSGGVAGALNSVAGGGSFLTFPSLVCVGVPPVIANATSAVALWPAQLASTVAYRRELAGVRRWILALAIVSAAGGFTGALLLLHTSNAIFSRVIPYLLLGASLLFTFGKRFTTSPPGSVGGLRRAVVAQALVAIYGGYFGGGMGIVMLALFSTLGMTNIHAMNALKTMLAALINLVAISTFIAAGAVAWRPGIVMVTAATLGGYFGAAGARHIRPALIRRFVLIAAWSMTAYFFFRAYAR